MDSFRLADSGLQFPHLGDTQVVAGSSELFDTSLPGSHATAFAANGDALDDCTREDLFLALLSAFKATGGVKRGDELRRTLLGSRPHMHISLGKLFEQRAIFSFQWRSEVWVPMFQFKQSDLSIRPNAQRVRMELGEDFNDWEVCCWFAEPNSWLRASRPVDVLDSDVSAVLQAARADRFVVAG